MPRCGSSRFPVLRRANQSTTAFLTMVFQAVAAVPRIIGFVRHLRPSAVYVNTVTLPWWLLAARLAGVPTIAHLHEAEKNDSLLVRAPSSPRSGWPTWSS